MVEVLVCKDTCKVKELYKAAEIEYKENSLCIRAMDKEECLGYCLFEIEGERATVLYIYPESDRMLADGLLRTALHVGNERGIAEAFYGQKVDIELLRKIDFLEDETENRLKLQNLFTDCCCCSSTEK